MNCDEIDELAGAYAVQALPQETLAEIDAHLRSCPAQVHVAGLRAVAMGLAWAAPEREPPAALKARLLTAVRGEADAAVSRLVRAEGVEARRRRWAWPRLALPALAALLALAVAGLLGWNTYLQTGGTSGQQAVLMRVLEDGGAARGQLLYSREGKAALLTISGLQTLPADKTYQVWAISDGRPVGIGLFSASAGGEAAALLAVDFARVEVIAITIEPANGSLLPTTQPILKAKL